jgi:choice-of-anchor B domain-containing protein
MIERARRNFILGESSIFRRYSSLKSFGEAQDKICRVQPIDGIPGMFSNKTKIAMISSGFFDSYRQIHLILKPQKARPFFPSYLHRTDMRIFLLAIALCCGTYLRAQMPITHLGTVTFTNQVLSNIWGYTAPNGTEYALVGTKDSFVIIDLNTLARVVKIKCNSSSWREIKTYGQYAYCVTEGGGGVLIVNMGNLHINGTVTSKFYTGSGQIPSGLSVNTVHALQVDETAGFLYLFGSNLYNGRALMFNLADPYNPVYAGYVNTGFATTNHNYVHDGYADNNILYAGHIYAGFFSVINTTVKSTTPPVISSPTTQTTPLAFTHNTWRSGNTLFTTDEKNSSFLASYDISNLGNITLLDTIKSGLTTTSIVHNTYIRDDYAISSWYKDGFTVTDVSRPHNIIKVGGYDSYPSGSGGGFDGAWGVFPYFPSGKIIVSNISGSNAANGEMWVFSTTYERACYLEGVVTNATTGDSINAANVQLLSGSTVLRNTQSKTFKGWPGAYAMGQYSEGTYTLKVTRNGFQTYTTSVTLTRGTLTTVNVPLQPISAPVELTRFEASALEKTALLQWTTAAEYQNKAFDIEYSTDINNWETMASIPARGGLDVTTAYEFETPVLRAGTYYFRLRQIDNNGKTSFSPVRSVVILAEKYQLSLRPNLVQDYCELVVRTNSPFSATLEIWNAAGQIVIASRTLECEQDTNWPLDVSTLATGRYFLKIHSSEGSQVLPFQKL